MTDVDYLRVDIETSGSPGPDIAVAALAEEQHAVVEYGQLRQLGLGRGAIKHRARTGRLHRLYTGVYAVGHRTVSRKGHWKAAVLACGPDAVLSHRSAAALWNLLPDRRAAIDVTVPRSRHGSGPIVVHNVRHLHPADRHRVDGIAVTSVARVLLDLAETVSPRELARAIDEAERLALFDLRAIEKLCRRSPGRHGVRPPRGDPPVSAEPSNDPLRARAALRQDL
jgi:predicted transcriptional regulator of viral defense system